MSNQIVKQSGQSILESVVIQGDLSQLQPAERIQYYHAVCQSVGLNPLTQPFQYITLNGKLTLYARKDATDQLRNLNGVSITNLEREKIDDIYTVTAYASDKSGRSDSSIGAVAISNLKGDALANAIMKAETKAKRRVTLSICGLGMLDETELETIHDAVQTQVKVVDPEPANEPEPSQEPAPSILWHDFEGLNVADMNLELASGETDKDGVKYTDLATDKLQQAASTMALMVKTRKTPKDKNPVSDADIEKYNRKLSAIKSILQNRESTPGQEQLL